LAEVKKDDKWGYIDTTGKEIIPCVYEEARDFADGLAAVGKDDKWGYIDKTGKEIIPCLFDNVVQIKDGLAEVKLYTQKGFADTKGYFIGKGIVEKTVKTVKKSEKERAAKKTEDEKIARIQAEKNKIIANEKAEKDRLEKEQLSGSTAQKTNNPGQSTSDGYIVKENAAGTMAYIFRRYSNESICASIFWDDIQGNYFTTYNNSAFVVSIKHKPSNSADYTDYSLEYVGPTNHNGVKMMGYSFGKFSGQFYLSKGGSVIIIYLDKMPERFDFR
jgi:hypothetical protein